MRDATGTRFRSIVAAAIVSAAALTGAPGAEAAAPQAAAAAPAQAAAPRDQAGAQAHTPSPRGPQSPGTVPRPGQGPAPETPAPAPQPPTPERKPLPDVAITTIAGVQTMTSRVMPAEGKWLLLHVARGSVPCDSLLGRMQGEEWQHVPARLVIVVAGSTPAEVVEMAKRYPALASATWYADQPGALAAALDLQGTPATVGMNRRGVQWTLAGVLSESKRLQSALTRWVAVPETPEKQAVSR